VIQTQLRVRVAGCHDISMVTHPQNPASFNHRLERLSTGRTYHFVDQLPPNYQPLTTPTLLCVHGFPDLWYFFLCCLCTPSPYRIYRYGWRYQIGPWSTKFRVVVPDMLGYGSTDKPQAPSEYSTRLLSNDLVAILDLIGVHEAVCVSFWAQCLWG
jgi:soluble epoxide hydrolase/lipid-phosphate phosphatase